MNSHYAKFEGYIPHDDNPRWGQSYYYNFYDPKTRIGAFVRLGLLENQDEANTWFVVFKDGQPLFNRNNLNLPYTKDRPATGVEAGGMRIEALVPLKKTRITFQARDFSAEFVWDERHPMEDCIAKSKDEDGSFARELCHIHLEGISRISGHIVSRGERTEVDGSGFRDISAGPRNWDAVSTYRLAWPVFENGMAFAGVHGIATNGASAYMKMFNDGERWLGIKSIEDDQVVGDDGFTVAGANWRFVDELGRKFEFTAKPVFRCFFPADTFLLCDQLMEFRLGDGTIGYGLYENGYRLPWQGAASR